MPTCAVASCGTTGRNINSRNLSFFKFPKDQVLCKKWVFASKRKDYFNVKTSVVCSSHFEPLEIEGDLKCRLLNQACKRTLVSGAIPTLCLPKVIERGKIVTGGSAARTSRNVARNVRKSGLEKMKTLSPKKALNLETIDAEDCSLDNCELQSEDLLLKLSNKEDKIQELAKKCSSLQNDRKTLQAKLRASQQREKAKMAQKVKWRNRCAVAEQRFRSRKSNMKKQIQSLLGTRFTQGQIKSILNNKRVNWKREDIIHSLALRALSKKAYMYVREKLNVPLPGLSTMQRWIKNFQCQPGLLHNVLQIMKSKEENELYKYSVLSFDEMNIDLRVCYDFQGDIAYGPYSNAQVILLRGLFYSWKQPVFYQFDVSVSKELLLDIISQIENVGYHVIACVSDLGGKNTGVWKDLKITEKNASFQNPGSSSRVWVLADMPHSSASSQHAAVQQHPSEEASPMITDFSL